MENSVVESNIPERDYRDIERSIQKKFHRSIWSKFVAGINEYNLVEPNDKIAVCISGGKDSMLMAKLLSPAAQYARCRRWLETMVPKKTI